MVVTVAAVSTGTQRVQMRENRLKLSDSKRLLRHTRRWFIYIAKNEITEKKTNRTAA